MFHFGISFFEKYASDSATINYLQYLLPASSIVTENSNEKLTYLFFLFGELYPDLMKNPI